MPGTGNLAVIRDALGRLTDGSVPEGTNAIGGYWTRTNDPEIDIIGADRTPIAKKITAVGSIKWLENKPFDIRDLARLIHHTRHHPPHPRSRPRRMELKRHHDNTATFGCTTRSDEIRSADAGWQRWSSMRLQICRHQDHPPPKPGPSSPVGQHPTHRSVTSTATRPGRTRPYLAGGRSA